MRLPFKYDADNINRADCPTLRGKTYTLNEVREIVHDYIDSFFFGNDNYFATSCASTYCAFFGIHVAVMMVALGEGGDGKGLFDILEATMFNKGKAATLDPSIFIDDNEWRKSAHFGLHKKRVCIKEAKGASATNKYNVDVLKRFIVGEELIVRANFGFSTEVRFDRMKKQQSCNYDDVGVMISIPKCVALPQPKTDDSKTPGKQKSPTESLGRRFLASAVGLATLVTDPVQTCHDEGRFLKMPSDMLENVFASNVAAHVYFNEILQPAWNDLGDEAAIVGLLAPDALDAHMKSSCNWYVQRVCGISVGPRPDCVTPAGGHDLTRRHVDVKDEDWKTSQTCIKMLWHEELKKTRPSEHRLVNGRACRVGDWKVCKLLFKELETSRNNGFKSLLALAERCGPLANYLLAPGAGTNFFGA